MIQTKVGNTVSYIIHILKLTTYAQNNNSNVFKNV